MVAATTAYRTQNAKMGCYQSGPTYRKEPRNSAISRCFWAFNYIYACIKDCVLIDPCMGSGHILIYCFDVLMQIYESQGYTQRDAVQSILENNLFGLDIDKRATQLAYFAVMMKARQYDRRIFSRNIKPHVFVIEESNDIKREQLKYFGVSLSSSENCKAKNELISLLDIFVDAREYGSILNVDNYDWELLYRFVSNMDDSGQLTFDTVGINKTQEKLYQIIEIAQVMAKRYNVVVTNPPYMNSSYMPNKLKKFIQQNYPEYKGDLFAVFVYRILQMTYKNGHVGMLTPYVWMFISAYEKMRNYVLRTTNITSLVQLEYNAFEAACVPVASFTLRKIALSATGEYIKLSEFRGAENQASKTLEAVTDRKCGYRYTAQQLNFCKIPGSPIAYWVSDTFVDTFEKGISIDSISLYTGSQNITANNEQYLRYIWEVSKSKVGKDKKWVFYIKGGAFRKWYGNIELFVDWSDTARDFYRTNSTSNLLAEQYRFKEGITYTELTSSVNSFRYLPPIAVFDKKGPCIVDVKHNLYCLAFFNTCVAVEYFKLLNPTITLQVKDVKNTPIIIEENVLPRVEKLAQSCVDDCREDWDSFETSWDFLIHPLVKIANELDLRDEGKVTLMEAYEKWERTCNDRFDRLKANEEELNRIFIEVYGLQEELTPEVEDKDVTVRKAELGRDIRSLISYALGCMLGRYSLDESGISYAGGEWNNSKYKSFIPDRDNCIPITDEEYFEDDIVGLFCAWLSKSFGIENLEINLDFIAKVLGNKGTTSREVIRNYFINDFIKDHIKTYQKRPIYWLFDSGKQNGFKALIYMHRWNADTVGSLRVEYLHKMQHIYEHEIVRMQEIIDNSSGAREASKATKRKDKLLKQLKETKEYDAKLSHIALSRIEIDLDDGVKVNYEKVQTAKDGKKMQILAKI